MPFARVAYYLSSIITLLLGIRNWPTVGAVFLGLPVRRPIQIRLRASGQRFKVRTPMDIWVIKETCLDQDYEKASVTLQDGWTVLDIGAGLGDFTIHAAGGHARSTVYAYEPFPESFNLMQQNVGLNGLRNVRMFPEAVGSSIGMLELSVAPEAVQHSTAAIGQHQQAQTKIEVPCTTLDQIMQEHSIQRCDFLKIDCEGAEYEILFSASEQTLKKIKHVCLEYHDGVTTYAHDDLVTFFRSKGFQVKLQPNPVHNDLGFLYASRA